MNSKEAYFYFVGAIFPVITVDLLNRFKAYIQHTPIFVDYMQVLEINANPQGNGRIQRINQQSEKVLCWYIGCYCLESDFKTFFKLDNPYNKTKEIQQEIEKRISEHYEKSKI